MGKAYYDVYDRQGNKLIEEVTSKEIGEAEQALARMENENG